MVRQIMKSLPAALIVCVLASCGSGKPDVQEEGAGDAQATPPAAAAPTVFDDQLKALEKAKQVEENLQDEKKARDEAIDEASGG